jgi:DNA-binding NarL/FixJ family response regulator
VNQPIRVLVADDDDLVRTGLRLMLGSQPDLAVVGEAADGDQAVRLAAELAPDVVLMDIRMPGVDGLAATERITGAAAPGGEDRRPRIIILTTFETEQYVYEALRAGASGSLLKRARPEAISEAIRVVAGGDALLAPSVTRQLIARYAAGRRPPAASCGSSPSGSARSSSRSPGGCPTARSPRGCSSASTPSRPISSASSPSWTCATEPRPSCSPTSAGWCNPTILTRLQISEQGVLRRRGLPINQRPRPKPRALGPSEGLTPPPLYVKQWSNQADQLL